MSTPNTASNFISLINQNYPVAGQDNNTQGFRNNFTNIKKALTYLDNDVYDLQLTSIRKNTDSDFNNFLIEKATFKDCAISVYDRTDSATSGDIIIDYENGSYQKYKLSGGFHLISFTNWPDTLKTGRLTLSLISESITGCTIDFNSFEIINLGPDVFPIEISNTVPKIFEIWNDGDSGVVFIQSSRSIDKASTLTLNIETLILGGTNTYNTVTNSYAPYATSVKANGKAGNLALVPNKITASVTASPLPVIPGASTSTVFQVNTTTGIMAGATFDLPNSTSTVKFNVISCTTTSITVSPPFETVALNINDIITFVNPTFNDQPKVVTFKSSAQTTTTSAANDLQGTIYASSTTFYVAHSDHAYNSNQWLKITADHMPQHLVEGSTAITATATNSSTFIATTAHVKNAIDYVLPKGMITLWYGSIASIPTGWALCNGTNGTPDLRDRFIVGAGNNYAVGATGGTTSTVIAPHNHGGAVSSTTLSINQIPSHTHTLPADVAGTSDIMSIVGTGSSDEGYNSGILTGSTGGGEGHDHTITQQPGQTINHIPPYYALCYIMKT